MFPYFAKPRTTLDGASSLAKTSGSAKISDRADFVDVNDESSCSSFSSSVNKPHKANDARWEAIKAVRAKDGLLAVGHFRLLRKLGRVKWNKMLFCYESNGQSIFVKA
ncbi:hypothetical protein Q3G72_013027 [Acer saccharum]|nr:hypothetical protein Q3G72_013027 [Acer saccharum]